MSNVTPLSLSKNALSIVTLCSALSSQCCQAFGRVALCSKGKLSWEFTHAVKINFCVSYFWVIPMVTSYSKFHNFVPSFVSSMWDSSCPSSMRLFLSTSAHHLGISLRNNFSTLRYICLNDIFSRSRHRFTSLTFDQNIPLGVQHQNVYSNSVDCLRVPSNQVVSTMFDIKTL